jgi:hypothetical protein
MTKKQINAKERRKCLKIGDKTNCVKENIRGNEGW